MQADTEDTYWDDRFGVSGTDLGGVTSIVHDSRMFWFGGDFSTIGGIQATNVARWDGTNWGALGNGANGAIFTLAVMRGDLYVAGGSFYEAGGEVRAANSQVGW